MKHDSVIINHRVALPGTSAHRSTFGHILRYIATRQGVDLEPTQDDILRFEADKALGYIAHRPGAVPEPGMDCALFDQIGIADLKGIREELSGNPGAVIQSVVAVRREDAAELGLQGKQDFERLLRAEWAKHIVQMGIMRRQDIRWVAAFHENSPRNWHAHVITWDASGRFGSLIPKRKLEAARRDLVYRVMEPARQRVSLVKGQARDDLVRAIGARPLSREDRRIAREVVRALPKRGSLMYANLKRSAPEAVARVDALVAKRIAEDPALGRALAAYRSAASRNADLKGLKEAARTSYLAAAEEDLASRLGNAQIRQIRDMVSEPSLDPVEAAVTVARIASAIGQGTPYRVQGSPLPTRKQGTGRSRSFERSELARKGAMRHGLSR